MFNKFKFLPLERDHYLYYDPLFQTYNDTRDHPFLPTSAPRVEITDRLNNLRPGLLSIGLRPILGPYALKGPYEQSNYLFLYTITTDLQLGS